MRSSVWKLDFGVPVSRHMGGVGLYISLRDYLKLLRHILQIHGERGDFWFHQSLYSHIMPISAGKATNPILKPESVSSLFVGASTEAGIKNLDLFTISAPTKGNSWSTALAVSSVDAPWGRKKGSAFCELGLINRLASLKLAKTHYRVWMGRDVLLHGPHNRRRSRIWHSTYRRNKRQPRPG